VHTKDTNPFMEAFRIYIYMPAAFLLDHRCNTVKGLYCMTTCPWSVNAISVSATGIIYSIYYILVPIVYNLSPDIIGAINNACTPGEFSIVSKSTQFPVLQ
jgi:hypothetical protein